MREPSERSAEECIAAAQDLGTRCNGHPEEVTSALPDLLHLLEDENRPQVLVAIADALGAMWDPRCLPPLLTLVQHPDDAVRLSVAQALNGTLCNHEAPEGIAALIPLSGDPDGQVRDWATFALAQSDSDSDAVRQALWARVEDPDGDTLGEALVGLARRHDPRVLELILRRLAEDPGNLIVEAAGELGDPAVYPSLVRLRKDGWAESDPRGPVLTDALDACKPVSA